MTKAARWAGRPIFALSAGIKLRRSAQAAREVDELVDLAFHFRSGLDGIDIAPWQKRSEITALLRILKQDPPRRILEIGTASGGTLFLLSHIARPDATLITLDLRHGRFGGGYPRWRIPLYWSFVRRTQSLHLLRGDSHDARMLARVQKLLEGEPVDLLFIDGDHTYDGVLCDFRMYAPLVRDGGTVAIHDIVPGTTGIDDAAQPKQVGHVPEIWRRLRIDYGGTELVDDWHQGVSESECSPSKLGVRGHGFS